MKLNFVSTIGGRLFYLGDDGDENAPVLSINFGSDFDKVPKGLKKKIAREMFDLAMKRINKHEKVSDKEKE